MLFLDLGENQVSYLNDVTNEYGTIDADSLFDFTYKLPSGTQIIGESAHFGTPRTRLSKSQYFFEDELLGWYSKLKEKGLELYLASANETYKYRLILGLEKTDHNDLLSLKYSIDINPNALINMKRPPKNFIKERFSEAKLFRDQCGEDANIIRNFDYSHSEDHISKWLYDNVEEIKERLSPSTQLIMRLNDENIYYQKNNKNKNIIAGSTKRPQKKLLSLIRGPSIISILTMLMKLDGSLRTRELTNDLVGWYWAKNEILLLKAYRPVRCGTLRSNLQHWGLKNYTAEVLNNKIGRSFKPLHEYTNEEKAARKQIVKDWNNAVHDLFRVFKNMLKEQYGK